MVKSDNDISTSSGGMYMNTEFGMQSIKDDLLVDTVLEAEPRLLL